MDSLFIGQACGCLAGLVMFSSSTATSQLLHAPEALKVQVIAPPTLHLINDNRLSEAFMNRIREAFSRSGFPVPIESLRPIEDATKIPSVLTIKVAAWKMDEAGNFDCTFTARLRTPQGTQDLGVFSNTSVEWSGCGEHFGISSPMLDAKNEAFDQLYAEVRKSFVQPNPISELCA